MSLVDALIHPFAGIVPRPRGDSSGLSAPQRWLIDWVRGDSSDSGVSVTGENATTCTTIWQAVNVIAGDMGQLPFNVYRRTGDSGRDEEVDRTHPLHTLVRHRPNPYMSWQDFTETMMHYALVWGNGVAEIKRDNRGRPVQLTPLLPDRTWMEIVDGVPWIVTRVGGNAKETGSYHQIRYRDCLHIKGLSNDGFWGIYVVEKARNSWGLTMATEKYANKFFSNHAIPSGVLEHPHRIGDEDDIARVRKDWKKLHEGLDNVGRVAVLEEGMTFKPMSFNNKDSQWLEGRTFQRVEIAGWFFLPPHKVGALERATFSNIEHQQQDYLNTSLMRWLIKWSEECREKLLNDREKAEDSHFFKHNTKALLRGDLASRYSAYTTGLGGAPFLTVNEVRRAESMVSVEDGDAIRQPLNMNDPGGDDNDPDDRNAPPNPGGPAQNADKEAFRRHLQYITSVEQKRIVAEARRPDRFIAFMEKFYAAGQWPARLRETLVPWGQADRSEAWCRRSLEILDQVVGTASASELGAAIDQALKEWPARVEAMVWEVFP
jgi:HK97 family phage portal protein